MNIYFNLNYKFGMEPRIS